MNRFNYYHLFCCFIMSGAYAQSIDDLGIMVTSQHRQYVFTNKEAGTYHGEVNGQNTGGWQGWFVNAEKIFHDYSLTVNNKVLDRTSSRSTVFPHQLVRTYPDGTKETMTFLDSLDVLVIEVNNPKAMLSIQPADNFTLDTSISVPFQHWKRIHTASEIVPTDFVITKQRKRNSIIFSIVAGRTIDHLIKTAQQTSEHSDLFISRRKTRMQNMLMLSRTKTSNGELTTAIAWAKLQLDALIMNQSTGGARTKGIFAGLPWFNNYWGRDSFISLPGATYVIGNFSDARDILRSYAAFQELDTTSANYGRIPNLATPQSVIYNTADGTPWFVKSFYEYVKYSGDIDFVKEMYPVIVRSIEGTLQFHSDSLGFLTHGDAESWMDAVGPNGPWSPRGNRAGDVQALWHQQLMVGVFCAEYFNDFRNAARWKHVADKLDQNFRNYFVDTTNNLIIDHLKADGSPSTELRPNQLFTIDMIIPEDVRQNITRTVLRELVYEHGTATIAQTDSNFYPFHEYPPYYVKDAAYHNGTVWTWLNGTVIYAATRYDLQDIVFPVTKNSVHQMLHRGTVGALSELLDAHPRNFVRASNSNDAAKQSDSVSEPKLSGTYSQAWSSAEFIRSMYQDYFGVSVDVPSKTIRLQPKLPSEITSVEFEQRVGNGSVNIFYKRIQENVTVTIVPKNLKEKFGVNYLWVYKNGDAVVAPIELLPETTLTITHSQSALTVYHEKRKVLEEKNNSRIFLRNYSDNKFFTESSLAQPQRGRQFPVLRGPSHPLLTHTLIKSSSSAAALFTEADDPMGDDAGINGTYQYPSSQHFKKGILDITHAEFRYDEHNLFCTLTFSNLYNPGWHPEYGFQLTLAAIAINTGNGKQTEIGLHSNFRLDSTRAFDKLILVGGGVRILNESGNVLCEYIPKFEDVSNPVGNVTKKTIEFAVPLEYLGVPKSNWKISILIGAQDDHGGAGIGEFRSIEHVGSEWIGGGKNNPNDSNVYDVMILH